VTIAARTPAPTAKERKGELQSGPVWGKAMAAAFASPKFDDYLDRLKELDRKVVIRYGFNDPFAILWGEEATAWPAADCREFAESLLHSGQALEAQGDLKGAAQKYWGVARFGQVIDSQGHGDLDHWAGTTLQTMAYRRLQATAVREGNASEAGLFSYLITIFDPVRGTRGRLGDEWVFGQETSRRNAAVLQISSLMMLIFPALLAVAVSVLLIGGRRAARPEAPRSRPLATVVALASAIGLLLSGATVYLTYRPYWYIFQRTILKDDRSRTRDLFDFLISTRSLPGLGPSSGVSFSVYFWAGVILLGMMGLILIFLRQFGAHTRAKNLRPRVT